MGARGPVKSALALVVIVGACSTEYNRPAGTHTVRPSSGGGSSFASGGTGGFPVLPNGGVGTSTGGKPPGEPPGDSALTLVNGIVDAPRVLLCLTDGAGHTPEGVGEPFPEGGLEYAHSLFVEDLAEMGLDEQVFAPAVIAGDLELVRDMDCEEALATARAEQALAASGEGGAGSLSPAAGGEAAAAPASAGSAGLPEEDESASAGAGGAFAVPSVRPVPRLRTGLLPMVPAGTLSAGHSMLFVGAGCIGGPAYVTSEDKLACGAAYSGETPTLSAALVRLSRRRVSGKLGLQVLQASLATEEVEVRSAPLTMVSELPLTLTTQQGYGVIAPASPRLDFPASSYGATTQLWGVQVAQGGSVLYSEPWAAVNERSGIAIEDGRSYTLVLVGPGVGLAQRYFWNASRVVVVDNDPTSLQ